MESLQDAKAKGLKFAKDLTSKVKSKVKKDKKDDKKKDHETNGTPVHQSGMVSPRNKALESSGSGSSPTKTPAYNPGKPSSTPAANLNHGESVLFELPDPESKKLEHITANRVTGHAVQQKRLPTRKGGARPGATPGAAANKKVGAATDDAPARLEALVPPKNQPRAVVPASASSAPVTVGDKDFIRVFLDDENVKTISMNPPFSVANLIEELRKKMYLVDTEGFVIHEVRSTGVRILDPSEDVYQVMKAWTNDPQAKLVFKKPESPKDATDEVDEAVSSPTISPMGSRIAAGGPAGYGGVMASLVAYQQSKKKEAADSEPKQIPLEYHHKPLPPKPKPSIPKTPKPGQVSAPEPPKPELQSEPEPQPQPQSEPGIAEPEDVQLETLNWNTSAITTTPDVPSINTTVSADPLMSLPPPDFLPPPELPPPPPPELLPPVPTPAADPAPISPPSAGSSPTGTNVTSPALSIGTSPPPSSSPAGTSGTSPALSVGTSPAAAKGSILDRLRAQRNAASPSTTPSTGTSPTNSIPATTSTTTSASTQTPNELSPRSSPAAAKISRPPGPGAAKPIPATPKTTGVPKTTSASKPSASGPSSLKPTPKGKPAAAAGGVESWTQEQIGDWLDSIGMGTYRSHFAEANVTGAQLLEANVLWLQGEVGVMEMADCDAIVKAVESLKAAPASKPAVAGGASALKTSLNKSSPATPSGNSPATSPAGCPAVPKTNLKPMAKATSKEQAAPPASAPVSIPKAGSKGAPEPSSPSPGIPKATSGVRTPASAPTTSPLSKAVAKGSPSSITPPAAAAKTPPKKEIDIDGQTLVRVYFSDTVFRAFVVNPETTGEALTELIRSRYRDLVQRITGVDANNCALFESRNIIHERAIEGSMQILPFMQTWTGNSCKFLFKDKVSLPPKLTKEVLKVFFADGTSKPFILECSSTVAELCALIAEKMKIEEAAAYSLYEVEEGQEPVQLAAEDNVFLIKQRWAGSEDIRFVYSNTRPPVTPGSSGKKKAPPKNKALYEKIELEKMQARAFTAWANFHLSKRGKSIDSLTDLRDASRLLLLTEIISGKSLMRTNPISFRGKLEAVNAVLSWQQSNGAPPLTDFYAEDILDGNTEAIAAVLWPLVYWSFLTPFSPVSEADARVQMLVWVKNPHPLVRIDNFSQSFKHGLAFCGIISKYRPNLLDFKVAFSNKEQALSMALAAGESEGIPKDFFHPDSFNVEFLPDERAVFAYLTVLYRTFNS